MSTQHMPGPTMTHKEAMYALRAAIAKAVEGAQS